MAAKYRWKITRDHLAEPGEKDDVGREGPHNLDPALKSNPTPFTLYDDDGDGYYSGTLYGDFSGLEPLDDFGMGWAGCTGIKVRGEWV